MRHAVDAQVNLLCTAKERMRHRDSNSDVGFGIRANELKRSNLADIFFANMQRAKESMRVLEEFAKLKDTKAALAFKKIRYRLYTIEKKASGKVGSLR